ncbi:hypothetical protein ACP70R_025544 [Stipagrostis hirtigluma subsp. patula]
MEALPVDLLLDVVARSDDAATVVRCAAASKPLRRAVLEPAFRRRLAARRAAANGGGFDPALLLAVSYRLDEHGDGGEDRIVVEPSRRLGLDGNLLLPSVPACSRDGLLVLWRNQELKRGSPCFRYRYQVDVDVRVCNTLTGHVTSLPRAGLSLGFGTRGVYRSALLTAVDGAGRRCFELLVMDQYMDAQTFSSKDGKWGAVRHVFVPSHHGRILTKETYNSPAAAVVGRTVHWLCLVAQEPLFDDHDQAADVIILALHADDAVGATAIELPRGCRRIMECARLDGTAEGLLLAATAEGTRLSLLAGEPFVISMWTRSPEEGPSSSRWSRQVVIRRHEIDGGRKLAAGLHDKVRFEGFGERSGAVVLWMERVGLVQLNLETKKAAVLRRCSHRDTSVVEWACLHEMDLVSLLGDMKVF